MSRIFFLFLFCASVLNAQENHLVVNVSLKAHLGQYVSVNTSGTLAATAPDGFGAWETFRLFNQTNPDRYPVSGDKVVLQAWNGKFAGLLANGNVGVIDNYNDSRCHFIIQRASGAGAITTNDRVSLRNVSSNKFLMAENGGGAAINNNATAAREFETFGIKLYQPVPARLRITGGGYLSNGTTAASASISVQSGEPGLATSLSFINHSRKEREIFNGDEVSLMLASGRFLQATATGVSGMANRCAPEARFQVGGTAGRALRTGDVITLQLISRPGYLSRSSTGITTSTAAGRAENNFELEFANVRALSGYPDASGIAGRPFATIASPKTGVDSLIVFHVHVTDEAAGAVGTTPISRTNTEIQSIINTQSPGLNTWLRANSNNNYGVVCKAVHGPLRVSKAFAEDYSLLLNAAEDARVPLNSYGNNRRVWDNAKYKLLVLAGGGYGGQQNYKDATSRSGFRFASTVAGAIVTNDIDKASRMVIGHEASHLLLGVNDRYTFRRPILGDVMAYSPTFVSGHAPQVFFITRRSGVGPITHNTEVVIQCGNKYLAPSPDAPHYLNLYSEAEAGNRKFFVIQLSSGTGNINDGQNITLRTFNNKYVMAMEGGNSAVVANSTSPGAWETFKLVNLTRPRGALNAADNIALISSNGNYLEGDAANRTTPSDKDRKRGYTWGAFGSLGSGGLFDNSDVNYTAVLLNLYDRIRLGWVNRKYITPDTKGTFLIRPFVGSGDGFILFDPLNPSEWYTLENRQRQENLDEIPSSGLVISWVCESETYWRNLYNAARDDDFSGFWVNYPAVISAAAPRVAPNPFYYPPFLSPASYTKRNEANAAFTNQEAVLPKGDGTPSRFHISVKQNPDRSILLTVH